MLHNKGIDKISELKNGFNQGWLSPDFILRSLNCLSFSAVSNSLKPIKVKGYSFQSIFSIMISLPFIGVNSIHQLVNTSPMKQYMVAKKDTFYRIKNNTAIDWREILWLFVGQFCKIMVQKGAKGNGSPKCLIIDDSLLEKSGKMLENVSRVWDHVTHRYVIGYKLLVLSYWDGGSSIVVDFSLHREKGKNVDKPFGLKKKHLKKQFRKTRQKEQPGHMRSKEADESKIDNAAKMIKRALNKGLEVDYLLMDSWFTCWEFIDLVSKQKDRTLHLIGMYKIAKTKFTLDQKQLTFSQINNQLGSPKRCRKFRLYYKEAAVEIKGVSIKLFFSRQGKNGKWKVLLTTDKSISFIKMIEIYQIRWTIEVFFKEAKQLLQLGKCQSNDFDAQIANATMTMIQHLLLTMQYRFDNYETKGALFDNLKENIIQHRLNERLWGLFIELLNLIEELFEGIDGNEIMENIFNNENAYQKFNQILQLNLCAQPRAA